MNTNLILAFAALFILYRFLGPVLKGQLSYKSLNELLEGENPPLILDVRSSAEYRGGHIPGAKNIPHDKLPGGLKKKTASKERPIVVYCQSGSRASMALRALKNAGYENVQNFGSVRRWKGTLA